MLAPPLIRRRKLDVVEFHRMAEAGILHEDDRIELIEGELIEMAPIGSDHAGTVNLLTDRLAVAARPRAILAVQNPLRLGPHSEPQPDLMLLRPRADFYRSATPGPADVLLLIEVADTTAAYDREVKLPLYARHGIAEVWLVDLQARTVEVHRQPSAEGYRDVTRHLAGATIAPAALPEVTVEVAAVVG